MFQLVYLDAVTDEITEVQYVEFLRKYYREEFELRYKRINWLRLRSNYKILLALVDGVLAGQSSAYRCTAVISGKEVEWWWSIDTFILPEMRGKGIGRKIQEQFHKDLPNFSSLWYSPANGHIKRLCGAKEVCCIGFNYFPVGNYFNNMYRILMKKYFHKSLNVQKRTEWTYYHLNRFFCKKYIVEEIDLCREMKNIIPFINVCMQDKELYIKRDSDYMYWKYELNPTLKYHVLRICEPKSNEQVAILAFSDIFMRNLLVTPIKTVILLDIFIKQQTSFSVRNALVTIADYYYKRKQCFDGIMSLQNACYLPFFRYPLNGTPLLSTLKGKFENVYFGYSDQDMEQMI